MGPNGAPWCPGVSKGLNNLPAHLEEGGGGGGSDVQLRNGAGGVFGSILRDFSNFFEVHFAQKTELFRLENVLFGFAVVGNFLKNIPQKYPILGLAY